MLKTIYIELLIKDSEKSHCKIADVNGLGGVTRDQDVDVVIVLRDFAWLALEARRPGQDNPAPVLRIHACRIIR